MAIVRVIYWRDIPAQIISEATAEAGSGRRGRGRNKTKLELPPQFAKAIDAAAMRDGAVSADDYLAAWRKGEGVECGADIEAEAKAIMSRLISEYPSGRLSQLVANGGYDKSPSQNQTESKSQ